MRRQIRLFIAVLILIIAIPCTTFAASNTVQSGDFKFSISNGSATLVKYTGAKKNVTIPKSVKGATVKYIGRNAFTGNKKIEKVTIPASVIKIKDGAYNDTAKGAFSNCKNLKEVIIAKNSKLKEIGEWAFYKSEKLVSINLPPAIRYLELSCFENCTSLKILKLPEGLKYIGQNALGNTGIKSLHLPKSCAEIVVWNDMPKLESFTVAEGNPAYRAQDGVLYNRDEPCSLVFYPAGKKDSTYKVAKFAEQIFVDTLRDAKYLKVLDVRDCFCTGAYMVGDGACRVRCTIKVNDSNPYYKKVNKLLLSKNGKTLEQIPSNIEGKVIIPNGVEKIASYAAEHGNYTEIVLPETIKEIEGAAFWQSKKLEKITIPYGLKKLGGSTFQECINLKEIIIPEGVENIEVNTFFSCESLRTVTLPKSLKWVEWQAFSGCWDLNINYTGTKEQWKKIKIGDDNHALSSAKKTYSYKMCQSHKWSTKFFINRTATMERSGEKSKRCVICGKKNTDSVKSIAMIKTVKLKKASYKYNGKIKNPTIIVKDTDGNNLKKGTDYSLSVPKGRKKVGKYTYTVKFKGNYSGTQKLVLTIKK